MHKRRRTIDGHYDFTDEELLESVKEAYLRLAKIPSRSVGMGSNEHYASAGHAYWEAFGEWPGNSRQWLYGFVEGFECLPDGNNTGMDELLVLAGVNSTRIQGPSSGNPEYLKGFNSGMYIADQIFHHWPDSPNIYSTPKR
jgi:hypothetical protein